MAFDAEAFQYLRRGEPLGVRMFRRGGIEVGVEEFLIRRTGAELFEKGISFTASGQNTSDA
jgi:hypothetical protein